MSESVLSLLKERIYRNLYLYLGLGLVIFSVDLSSQDTSCERNAL